MIYLFFLFRVAFTYSNWWIFTRQVECRFCGSVFSRRLQYRGYSEPKSLATAFTRWWEYEWTNFGTFVCSFSLRLSWQCVKTVFGINFEKISKLVEIVSIFFSFYSSFLFFNVFNTHPWNMEAVTSIRRGQKFWDFSLASRRWSGSQDTRFITFWELLEPSKRYVN